MGEHEYTGLQVAGIFMVFFLGMITKKITDLPISETAGLGFGAVVLFVLAFLALSAEA